VRIGYVVFTEKDVQHGPYDEWADLGNVLAFKKNCKWVFVDGKTGEVLTESEYDEYRKASGLIPVRKNDSWGYIDEKTGKLVIDMKYKDAYYFLEGIFAPVSFMIDSHAKWGIINTKGQYIIAPQYDEYIGVAQGIEGCGFLMKRGLKKIFLVIKIGTKRIVEIDCHESIMVFEKTLL
jgi:hypothetical protein